jgi:hypothetical protein
MVLQDSMLEEFVHQHHDDFLPSKAFHSREIQYESPRVRLGGGGVRWMEKLEIIGSIAIDCDHTHKKKDETRS